VRFQKEIEKMKNKSKKGVSIMIGYVLLVSIAMIIGASTYLWMKSYVPADKIQCPDGVSLYLKKINCTAYNDDYSFLELTIKNSGRFNIEAYYAYFSVEEEKEPSIDLSNHIHDNSAISSPNTRAIYFPGYSSEANSFSPGDEAKHIFLVNSSIKEISIIPGRIEEIEGKRRYAACTSAKISEKVYCS
jgi:hypothetical protein